MTFQVVVDDPCDPFTIIPPTIPTTINYTIGDTLKSEVIGAYSINTKCDAFVTYALSLSLNPAATMPSVINLNVDGVTIDVHGTDLSEEGTYQLVVTATFDDPNV